MEKWMSEAIKIYDSASRRSFIGGSDARVIMGSDEAALPASGGRSEVRRRRPITQTT
jgi:hypothetical protein